MTVDERIRESLSAELALPDLDVDEVDRSERAVRGARARSRQRRSGLFAVVAVIAAVALVATGVVARRSSREVVRTGPTTPTAVAADGHLLTLVRSGQGALLVERSAATGRIERTLGTLPSGGQVSALSVSDNGQMAYVIVQAPEPCPGTAICLYHGTIERVPLTPSERPIDVLATGRPVTLAVSHDGRTLAWIDGGNGTESIHLRDLPTGHEQTIPLARITDQGFGVLLRASSLSFSSDGRQVAVSVTAGSSSAVEILDVDRAVIARVLQPAAAGHVWSAAVYRGSTDQLAGVDSCIQSSQCPTQLVSVAVVTGRSTPLVASGVGNPVAGSAGNVQLTADASGAVFAMVWPGACPSCLGPVAWRLLRLDHSHVVTLAHGVIPGPTGASGPPTALAWIH
jgi:hypothetical protein